MTTREAAIYEFLSSFGIPAYTSASVPEQAEYPYLSYNLAIGDFVSGPVDMSVDLWYYTESEAKPNEKVHEIEQALGTGGKTITYDNGAVWIYKGNPWCQSVKDQDNAVKHRYLIFELQFFEL